MTEPAVVPQDPWERFGWVMGAIWLVFLAFPILSSLQADSPWMWRIISVAAIVGFGAVYVAAFMRLDAQDSWVDVNRLGGRALVALLLLGSVPALVIGVGALGMLPFIVAFAMFSLRLRNAVAVGLVALAATVLIPLTLGVLDEFWFFILIVTLVFVSTGLVRVLDQRGAEHRELSREIDLVTERERVARDVHDVLGHSLTVITVKSELAQRLVDHDPERAKDELAQIQSLTRQALAEIRATVAGLRVARLADELAAAAVALDGAGIAPGLPREIDVVDPRHRITLAWVLREAVTNVVRHSRASRCDVELGPSTLTVTDDGVGRSDHVEGNGLRGVRERVAAAGGELTVTDRPDGPGTRLEVRL